MLMRYMRSGPVVVMDAAERWYKYSQLNRCSSRTNRVVHLGLVLEVLSPARRQQREQDKSRIEAKPASEEKESHAGNQSRYTGHQLKDLSTIEGKNNEDAGKGSRYSRSRRDVATR